jgi:hypothetical protein
MALTGHFKIVLAHSERIAGHTVREIALGKIVGIALLQSDRRA